MSEKTARLIRNFAEACNKPKQEIRAMWRSTPKRQRSGLRGEMEAIINTWRLQESSK